MPPPVLAVTPGSTLGGVNLEAPLKRAGGSVTPLVCESVRRLVNQQNPPLLLLPRLRSTSGPGVKYVWAHQRLAGVKWMRLTLAWWRRPLTIPVA